MDPSAQPHNIIASIKAILSYDIRHLMRIAKREIPAYSMYPLGFAEGKEASIACEVEE